MGPTTSVSPLVPSESPSSWALAALLAKVASDPRQTRQLHETLGGFCHQVRNHLNSLQMGLYLARRDPASGGDPDWTSSQQTCRDVERFVERLQQVFRPVPIHAARLPVGLLIDDRLKTWTLALASVGRRLVTVRPPSEPEGLYDPTKLVPALDDLVSWRASEGHPSTDLRVAWTEEGGWLRIAWDEPRRAKRASRPTTEASRICRDACAPLIVPLLARLMTLHGGTLDLSDDGLWRLTLSWPTAATPPLGMPP